MTCYESKIPSFAVSYENYTRIGRIENLPKSKCGLFLTKGNFILVKPIAPKNILLRTLLAPTDALKYVNLFIEYFNARLFKK
jgi:hypothetical protein